MSFLSNVFAAFIGARLPEIVVGGMALAIGGAYVGGRMIRNSFNEAAGSIAETIEAAAEKRRQTKAVKMLSLDELPTEFKKLNEYDQSLLIGRWVDSATFHRHIMSDKELGNFVNCLKIQTAEGTLAKPANLGNPEQIVPIIKVLDDNKDRIAPLDIRTITDSLLEGIKSTANPTAESVNAAMSFGRYISPEIATSGHQQICRGHMLAALQTPTPLKYTSYRETAALALTALDTLFLPKHAHGGDKFAAHLSLDRGGYTQDEKRHAEIEAHNFLKVWDAQTRNERIYNHMLSDKKSQDEIISQVKGKLGIEEPVREPENAITRLRQRRDGIIKSNHL